MTPAGRGGLGASSGRGRARGCPDDSGQGSSGGTSAIPPVFFIKGSAITRFSAAQPLPQPGSVRCHRECGAHGGGCGARRTGSVPRLRCSASCPVVAFVVVITVISIIIIVIIFKLQFSVISAKFSPLNTERHKGVPGPRCCFGVLWAFSFVYHRSGAADVWFVFKSGSFQRRF